MPRNRFTRPGLVVSGALLTCAATGFGASAAAHTDVHVGVHVDVAALFHMIDTNHDGQVSRVEYTNHANRVFRQCDTNHDGKLSEQELQSCTKTLDQNGVPVSGGSTQTAKAMNGNQDGAVSQQGYDTYVNRQFRKMDTNQDGKLSPAELRNGVQGAAPPASSRAAPPPPGKQPACAALIDWGGLYRERGPRRHREPCALASWASRTYGEGT